MSEPYSLAEVNTDSLKECLLFLSQSYPFIDEVAKEAFVTQVNKLDEGGSPHTSAESPTEIPPLVGAPTEQPAEILPTDTPTDSPSSTDGETTAPETPAEAPAAPITPQDATANETPAETPAATAPTTEEVAAAQAVIDAANAASSTSQG